MCLRGKSEELQAMTQAPVMGAFSRICRLCRVVGYHPSPRPERAGRAVRFERGDRHDLSVPGRL